MTATEQLHLRAEYRELAMKHIELQEAMAANEARKAQIAQTLWLKKSTVDLSSVELAPPLAGAQEGSIPGNAGGKDL